MSLKNGDRTRTGITRFAKNLFFILYHTFKVLSPRDILNANPSILEWIKNKNNYQNFALTLP